MASEVRSRAPSLLARWRYALRTCSPPAGATDAVTRWLVVTRACVQPMTFTSIAIGALLAARHPAFEPPLFALAAIGLVVAHAANNMVNDLFDLDAGLDTSTYPRTLYAPHPVVEGLISRRALIGAILAANLVDAAIMLALFVARGSPVLAFALAGLFVSVFYVAPPLRLKARGLGEPGVFLVWGPLMIGGLYYASTGTVSLEVLLASIPYALLVTTVLIGKHIDKAPWDRPQGIATLPVTLGERRSRALTRSLIAAFYAGVVALVLAAIFPLWTFAVAGAAPLVRKTWRTYSRSKPEEPPPGYPVWPLWFASWGFIHARQAGVLLVLGLFLGAVWPLYL